MKNLYIVIIFKIIPSLVYSQFGSNYFIDIDDINSIKLGMSFADVSSKIGSPVQIENSKMENNKSFYSYKYRVKEYGYNFRRFIKPDLKNKSQWFKSSYLVDFNFLNENLISITRKNYEDISNEFLFYDPAKLDLKALALGELKPLWIDIRDVYKIKIGMTEDEVVRTIGSASQLLTWETKNAIETKKVFYRVREILSLSNDKKKFNIDSSLDNYIIMKKSNDKTFLKPETIKLSPGVMYYETLDGVKKQIGLNQIDELIINGKKNKIEKDLKLSAGVWSHNSYNITFHFENQKLIDIKKE